LEKAGQSISLIVRDNGQGLPDDFALEEQSSIGMDLAQTLTQQLDGELTHASNGGARFQVDFKKEIDSTH
jgi:two-component sensor histidine kinase